MNITHLGCDPEVLLQNSIGEFISSQYRIGGSKDYPMDIGGGNALQEDNVTVEFNTPPCANVQDFIKNIRFNLQAIAERVKPQGLKVLIKPSGVFSDEELSTPGAQEFGCEPDYNIYTKAQNPRPNAKNKNLRSAGGHIHVECDVTKVDIGLVVMWMDVMVGAQLVPYDNDQDRRKLYGRAGAHRPKMYGVEYRTPSNIWISSDELIEFVWNQTDKALGLAMKNIGVPENVQIWAQEAINDSNMESLNNLMEYVKTLEQ